MAKVTCQSGGMVYTTVLTVEGNFVRVRLPSLTPWGGSANGNTPDLQSGIWGSIPHRSTNL